MLVDKQTWFLEKQKKNENIIIIKLNLYYKYLYSFSAYSIHAFSRKVSNIVLQYTVDIIFTYRMFCIFPVTYFVPNHDYRNRIIYS